MYLSIYLSISPHCNSPFDIASLAMRGSSAVTHWIGCRKQVRELSGLLKSAGLAATTDGGSGNTPHNGNNNNSSSSKSGARDGKLDGIN
jgi:hypothetical protein